MKFATSVVLALMAPSCLAFAPANLNRAKTIVASSAEAAEVPAEAVIEASVEADVDAPAEPFFMNEKMDFSKELGVMAPLGLFDPLNFLGGVETQGEFDDMRLKELTHGRVCMLAFVGYMINLSDIRLPGCEDVPAGLGAREAWDAAPAGPSAWFYGTLLLCVVVCNDLRDTTGFVPDFPGDFRNGMADGWDNYSEDTKLSKRVKELNNGRAAMMGLLGLAVHEKIGNLDDILPGYHYPEGAASSVTIAASQVVEQVAAVVAPEKTVDTVMNAVQAVVEAVSN